MIFQIQLFSKNRIENRLGVTPENLKATVLQNTARDLMWGWGVNGRYSISISKTRKISQVFRFENISD